MHFIFYIFWILLFLPLIFIAINFVLFIGVLFFNKQWLKKKIVIASNILTMIFGFIELNLLIVLRSASSIFDIKTLYFIYFILIIGIFSYFVLLILYNLNKTNNEKKYNNYLFVLMLFGTLSLLLFMIHMYYYDSVFGFYTVMFTGNYSILGITLFISFQKNRINNNINS